MGKGKTAKTGDKALYGSREELASQARNKINKAAGDDDDPMYDEVDRFHNEADQDFIKLDDEADRQRNGSDDEDEDLAGNIHSVMDLGAGGTSSEEEDDDDDDDDDSSSEDDGRDKNRYADKKAENYSSSDDSDDSSDDDDDDDRIQEDPRNWGKKKSQYYHGDTADLEIGQEEDDAFLEEEAAQEIQKSRFEEMDEDDFVLSGDDEEKKNDAEAKNESKTNKHEELQTSRDTSKLSKKETRKLLDKQYPELLPMVSYFSDIVKDLKDRTQIATNVLMEGDEGTAESVGATVKGQQYLLTKAMIQKSIALNSVMYILLRYASVGEEDATSSIQAHPVMDQLKKFTTLLENLEESVQKKTRDIDLQLDNLVKAAALMTNSGEDDDDSASDGEDESESAMEVNNEQTDKEIEDDDDDDDEASEALNEELDEGRRVAIAQKKQKDFERTLNEARFGLRPNEAKKSSNVFRKRRTDHLDDFGDLEEDASKPSGNTLATTMNTIEQRSKTASRKRRPAPAAEGLDDVEEYDGELAQGLKMMEEELGKVGGNDDDGGDDGMDMGGDDMTDPDADDKALGFYNKIAAKSKEKKSFKKSLYKVAPKFPRVDGEVAGERSISRDILKNRGLVAHKAKINRNPRVKKREQYRKALIRRKGAVREVRDAQEGEKYGGEQTGIKSRISRSRKLV